MKLIDRYIHEGGHGSASSRCELGLGHRELCYADWWVQRKGPIELNEISNRAAKEAELRWLPEEEIKHLKAAARIIEGDK